MDKSPTATSTTISVDGAEYRKRRKAAGMSIAACAEAIGISRPYLAKIELGNRTRVSPPVFAAMCTVLRITDRNLIIAHDLTPAQ